VTGGEVQAQQHRASLSAPTPQAALPERETSRGPGNQASLDALGLGRSEEVAQAQQISACLGELDLYGVQAFLSGLAQ
jgi:hypothetical protein